MNTGSVMCLRLCLCVCMRLNCCDRCRMCGADWAWPSSRSPSPESDSEDEEAKGPLLGSSDNKVAQQMWDDFTLADLVQLAKEHGVKRDGINWGKDGTPRKNKREIIDALIAKAGTDRSKDLQEDLFGRNLTML